MTVIIPSKDDHEGLDKIMVHIHDFCPVCGEERGAIYQTRSYDGSLYMNCDGWANKCGHVDTYPEVRAEAEEIRNA